MRKVYMFAPVENVQSYKGGIISIIQAYKNNNYLFQKRQYTVSYEPNPCNIRVKTARTVLGKVMYHLKYILRHYKNLYRLIENNDVDIIHVHTSRDIRLFEDLFLIMLLKTRIKCRVIVSIHRADLDKTISDKKVIQCIFLFLLRFPDRIIFLSKKTCDEFVKAGIVKEKTSFLPTFHAYSRKGYTRQKRTRPDQLKLLYMGFISKEKGIGELIEAMHELPAGIMLSVCGGIKDGEDYYINNLLSDEEKHIVFKGYVEGEQKQNEYKDADLFILPSYGEGLPLVILEAMHFALPVITTNVGAIPEVIENDINGLLIEPRESKAIVEAVLRLYKDEDLLVSMSMNNAILSEKFSIENNIERLCDIYDLSI